VYLFTVLRQSSTSGLAKRQQPQFAEAFGKEQTVCAMNIEEDPAMCENKMVTRSRKASRVRLRRDILENRDGDESQSEGL
jgi:hypothetical protein